MKGLEALYRTVQEDRNARVLSTLTTITAAFLPAQFLSGLYGMNFEYMPELSYEYAYFIWWGAVLVSFVLVAWYLNKQLNG